MWQQEGQGPRQLPGGKACTAAPASTEPCARRSRQGLGPACRGRTHAPGASASAPALLQPCLPTACVHSPLAQALLGQRQPMGPFTAAPIVTRPLCCHRPQSASQTSPARHPQPSSGNSSWPWAPKDPKDKKCRPISQEPGNPRASLYKAGTGALPHNPCQIYIWVTGPQYTWYIGVGFY